MIKNNYTVSRKLHDYILSNDQKLLQECFKIHKYNYSLAGVTFFDIGVFWQEWLKAHNSSLEGNNLVIGNSLNYRKNR